MSDTRTQKPAFSTLARSLSWASAEPDLSFAFIDRLREGADDDLMDYKTDNFGSHERAYAELIDCGTESGAPNFNPISEIERHLFFFQSKISTHILSESPRVLVLSSGAGETSVRLGREGARVLETNVSDLSKLTGPFHAIVDDRSLHCIIGRERMKFLDEVKQKLAPRGLFLVRTQCGNPPPSESEAFWKNWNPATRCQASNGTSGKYYGKPEDIRAELMIAGFQILSADCILQPDGWQILEIVARPKP